MPDDNEDSGTEVRQASWMWLLMLGAIATVTFGIWLFADTHAHADDVNRTGQGQQTTGAAPTAAGNPAQDDKPSYPGDQPQKQGMDPSSQVHNIEPRELSGKPLKESGSAK